MILCSIFNRLAQGQRYTIVKSMASFQTNMPRSQESKFLTFDNLVLRTLPVDSSRIPGSRQVKGACFSLVTPTPVESPKVVAVSKSALELLDISNEIIESNEFVEYFSGNKVMSGSETASHCYCGHQFGYFSGQLGDGAAIYLGEVINKQNQRWELQLKGAGQTPYSRTADGRKVLRSSIREFLCSEAMYNLGIPTTRAGSCITSETRVVRDIFYDGHPRNERCTIVSRIAETFLRFGSFEIFKPTDEDTGRAGPSVGQFDIMQKMLDYVLSTFYPHVASKFPAKETALVEMYREICHKTAKLVAKWQCFGFCHGVLNTDNMSIVGLTIDYGPFGFMERYTGDYVCNGSDDGARYSYKNQPDICEWNLKKFGEAISEAVPLERTSEVLKDYRKIYDAEYIGLMRKKLGLLNRESEEDLTLVKDLLKTMEETSSDFTNTFRCLSLMSLPGMKNFDKSFEETHEAILDTCFDLEELKTTCKPKMDPRQLQAILAMARENPAILQIMTGGRVGMITAELDNLEKTELLKNMSEEQLRENNSDKWRTWLGNYEKRLKQEADNRNNIVQSNDDRKRIMKAINPRFILRNHIAQNAIEEAEKGDFTAVQKVLELLQHPFDEIDIVGASSADGTTEPSSSCTQATAKEYTLNKTPAWALQLRVT